MPVSMNFIAMVAGVPGNFPEQESRKWTVATSTFLANFERVQFAAIRSSTAGREFEKPGSEWFEVPEA
jgi:hypothetical protein